MPVTVAVTGPTGEIGISAVDALEAEPTVERIIGLARRPFDPAARGWVKTEYVQADILDRSAIDDLVREADVVVHLAYLIMGSRAESRRINLAGTRNVFEATVAAARPRRLVYTSSVAAYGYHASNPVPLTEDTPTRGSKEHYYSEQKAECEALLHEVTDNTGVAVYVLRPCIVAGPRATMLADSMPWRALVQLAPRAFRGVLGTIPNLLPLMPDPGVGLQLVHHDDVASAIALAATGGGRAGAYNLAADGEVSLGDVARATGTRSLPVPRVMATATSAVLARLPMVPAAAEWVHTAKTSVAMDTTRAKRVLGWQPTYTAAQTLDAMRSAL
ncbi:MAG: NAD-dependent epimerase/dehydratase family protein [Actinomycetota bacterium]|nr:NAD-dependent epimerase/dehydratase family protein [Actinomycetota bacterium]